jgi:glutathione S-transferase
MIKVWGRMTSTNVQKVMWCIDELGVEHEHIDIPHGGASQDAAYLAMNPNGLVPTIEDDGFVLWESNFLRSLHRRQIRCWYAMADRPAPTRRR